LRKIAIYGKGGSGKSTISAALSVTFARRGMKVLHVGCDPKSDSTLTITGGSRPTTLLELLSEGKARPEESDYIVPGRLGIECVEAGGPEPGAGCGGRGIARMFELFQDIDLLGRRDYDVVMFDVLGDVVCGGFAAPLRYGFADRAFIVVSEEPLSVYAANNIIRALVTYSANGVQLGGLIHNVSDDLSAANRLDRFSKAIGGGIAGVVPRDGAIQEAELEYLTAADLDPESGTVAAINRLADSVLASFDEVQPLPRALTVDELFHIVSPERAGREPAGKLTPGVGETVRETAPSDAGPEEAGGEGAGTVLRELPQDAPVAAGEAGRNSLAAFLELSGDKLAGMHLEVSDFLYNRGTLQFSLKSHRMPELGIELKPLDSGSKSYAQAGDVSVSYVTSLKKSSTDVLDHVVRILDGKGEVFVPIREMLAADPESEVVPTTAEASDAVKATATPGSRHWSVWGQAGTRGKFFYLQERARLVLGDVRVADGSINVHHGTDACQSSEQPTTAYSVHFVRFPWQAQYIEHEERDMSYWFFTNIDDYELIAGTNAPLEQALDFAKTIEGNRPVCVDISCIPVIAGEDWEGVVRRFSEDYDGTVTLAAVAGSDETDQIVRVAQRCVPDTDAEAPAKVPNSVHLVGFPPTRITRELVELLEDAGVTVLQRQLPAVSLDGLNRYLEAEAQLLWPQSEYEPMYSTLFEKFPLKTVRITPPFGLEGTRRFVHEAAAAVGVPAAQVEERLGRFFAQAEAELKEFKPRAQEHRLGIALTSAQSDLANDAAKTCGVPLVSFLEDLGFKVELLLHSEEEARLNWWLKSGLSAVYSDLSEDRRVMSAGLGHFALADLEPGLEGAVRTARRLTTICGTPFFKNFARYIKA